MGGEPSPFINPVAAYKSRFQTSANPGPSYGSKYGSVSKSRIGDSGYDSLKKVSQSSVSGVKPQHDTSELKEGMKIRHDRFGNGVITKISQLSGEDMITVDFGVVGIKKLLLKFAKFQIQ